MLNFEIPEPNYSHFSSQFNVQAEAGSSKATQNYWQKFDPIEDMMNPPISKPQKIPPVGKAGGGFSLNLGAVQKQQKVDEAPKVPRLGGFLQQQENEQDS